MKQFMSQTRKNLQRMLLLKAINLIKAIPKLAILEKLVRQQQPDMKNTRQHENVSMK